MNTLTVNGVLTEKNPIENIENKEVWIGESEMTYDKKFYGIPFPIEDLNNLKPIQFYATTFLAPSNPELYLEKKYGKNWRIPDKKQFSASSISHLSMFQHKKFDVGIAANSY